MRNQGARGVEWPTLGLIVACYLVWGLGTTWLAGQSQVAGILVTALAIAFFSSLQHEVIHGHPFSNRWVNQALVFPALAIVVPYLRFRDTHIAHHHDEILTDPYDDPETNYLDASVWSRLPLLLRAVLLFNNTLFGRVLIGVPVSQVAFMHGDWRAIRAGDRQVLAGWLWQIPAVTLVVVWLLGVGQIAIWGYLAAAYIGLSLIKIRTFLEHQAHEQAQGRTVIIEDRGPLAFLFLNNNLHVVHHMHPGVPWYRLPAVYRKNRAHYLRQNDGYLYRSYAQVFASYLWHRKDPVAHPLWRRD